jgi:predicted ArsR family transcriptional regulator
MIDKLITILNRGGAISIDQIARELDTSPQLVIQLIEHLAMMGQLQQLGRACDSACNSCAVANNCFYLTQSRIWQRVG